MSLPLLERAITEADPRFVLSTATLPPPPGPGEQYRFHFDMTKCIGCKCCEVACNEQHGNPADIHWRRVGEIEAGEYPFTQRLHLSMGCNHCVDAACLTGCPVDAYNKDALTGLVLHSADACIGCQYCTWNCPYGVPQFNQERGVVGKCDMCHGRLTQGDEPACANACPEQAIAIEVVNIEQWKLEYQALANAPGMPPADQTISTTRITLPANLPANAQKGDFHRVRPEHPHWPLVFMLVLTQLSVGTFCRLLLDPGQAGAIAALLIGHLALAASTAHLGRPIHAYRALKMWRRSWLSREVLAFSVFAGAATLYTATQSFAIGAATVAAGLIGIACSAALYLVPARPAWNSWTTVAEFYLTAALLAGAPKLVPIAAAAQLFVLAVKYLRFHQSEEFELRQSARLLGNDLKELVWLRIVLLVGGALFSSHPASLAPLLAAEILGRYLFFVGVVPRNMAATFGGRRAA